MLVLAVRQSARCGIHGFHPLEALRAIVEVRTQAAVTIETLARATDAVRYGNGFHHLVGGLDLGHRECRTGALLVSRRVRQCAVGDGRLRQLILEADDLVGIPGGTVRDPDALLREGKKREPASLKVRDLDHAAVGRRKCRTETRSGREAGASRRISLNTTGHVETKNIVTAIEIYICRDLWIVI
ncbi:hypothetical protein D9M69_587410 [compost metagenome]